MSQIAAQIGRPYCAIDYICIDTGDDLLESIRRSIDTSTLFVILISGVSLGSMWVNAEQRYADYRLSLGQLGGVLPYIIDETIAIEDLPEWLLRYHVSRSRSPKVIARGIRRGIDDLVRRRQAPTYIGRGTLENYLTDLVLPPPGHIPRRALWLYGLPGVGRRTVLRHFLEDTFQFRHFLEIPIHPGDAVPDLAILLADELGRLRSPTSARDLSQFLTSESLASQSATVAQFAEELSEQSEAAILVDEGGLLDDQGRLEPRWEVLLTDLLAHETIYMFFVSRRRPYELSDRLNIPVADVPPLDPNSVGQVLARAAQLRRVAIAPNDFPALVTAIRGYLPSVTAVIELVASHGSAYVAQDSERLARFRTGPLTRYLNTVHLGSVGRRALGLLSTVSPLPAPAILNVLGGANFANDFGQLLDASLVVPDAHGLYEIASPVGDLVEREFRLRRDATDLKAIVSELDAYVRNLTEDDWKSHGALEVLRSYQRAALMVGTSHEWILASDVVRTVRTLYHQNEFDSCVELARTAVALTNNNSEPYRWLIRALTKLGHFDEAEIELERFRRVGAAREYYFLKGFAARYAGKPDDAISSYQRAFDLGMRGLAIHRELAMLLHKRGDVSGATKHLEAAGARDPSNRYLLDLRIEIACSTGDEAGARSLLADLEVVDDRLYYLNRASRVESQFGDARRAFELSDEALREARARTRRPPFHVLATYVDAAINCGSFAEAAAGLEELANHYPRRGHDIRVGLSVELAIAQGQYESALETWGELREQSRPVHLALRRKALLGKLSKLDAWDSSRTSIQKEIDGLASRIGDIAVDLLVLEALADD